jgi:hypothetical protein
MTTAEALALDIRELHPQRELVAGSSIICDWKYGGRIVSQVAVEIRRNSLVLRFARTTSLGSLEPVVSVVSFTSTPCHFGGERRWFRCPKCNRRIAVIYCLSGAFQCLRCHDLAYPSQRKRTNPADRARERAQAIRLRLGGSGNLFERFPAKPKWMRWRTYWHLEITAAEDAAKSFEQLKVIFFGRGRRQA